MNITHIISKCMCIYTHTYSHVYIYGQASGVPSNPPPLPWYGLQGVGGWRVRKQAGAVGAATGWWGGAGGAARAHTQALRKPYSL